MTQKIVLLTTVLFYPAVCGIYESSDIARVHVTWGGPSICYPPNISEWSKLLQHNFPIMPPTKCATQGRTPSPSYTIAWREADRVTMWSVVHLSVMRIVTKRREWFYIKAKRTVSGAPQMSVV